MPTSTLTVFLFLYDEKVQDCDTREEGCSIANSVASMIIRVFGYSFLKTSGMYYAKVETVQYLLSYDTSD